MQTELQTLSIEENGLYLNLEITPGGDVRLLHFSSLPLHPASLQMDKESMMPGQDRHAPFRLIELQAAGENQDDHHGGKHIGTAPANRLRFQELKDQRNESGRKLEISLEDQGLWVTCHLQLFDGIPVVRSWTEIENRGQAEIVLEYVSSFSLTGLAKEGLQPWDEKSRLQIPHNTWLGEAQWQSYNLPELGLARLESSFGFSLKRLSFASNGSMSTREHLPMSCFEDLENGCSLFWQIEHNGSWHWEVSDRGGYLYLLLSGPTQNVSLWWKRLGPGERFESVPVAVGASAGGFDQAMQELTRYRRAMRRPNRDNETLPVIFNDYMNCLMGDPTTDKLLPLIDAAQAASCEYFCIDAGWYAEQGNWWSEVGEWLPSKTRFPDGLQSVLDLIRLRGMVPGLWLEIEVVGIHSPLASRLPDNWFFQRHGKRVIDHGRYQLDFRNPQVREHAGRIIQRLVEDYGVGYIKLDYNIDAGPGTDHAADSPGDGMLGHQRGYLDWLDEVFSRYPDLVIENCSSGGMRMDYALLSRLTLQSTSDQSNYRRYARISAAVPSAVTPEQCLNWVFPAREADAEEVIFNMVNAMLGRILLSGSLAELDPDRLALVKEGIDYYKSIRSEIKDGLPIWPLGVPAISDSWISMGLRNGERAFLAIWRLESEQSAALLPIPFLRGRNVQVTCGYPKSGGCLWRWNKEAGRLSVSLPRPNTARLLEIRAV